MAKRARRAALALFVLMAAAWAGWGQGPARPRTRREHLPSESVRSGHRAIALALGDQLGKPGKERIVLAGILSREGRDSALRIIRELPDRFRLEEAGLEAKTLVSDGTVMLSSRGNVSESDQDEVESLVADSAEHFLYAAEGGTNAVRLLGRRFRTGRVRTANYSGPLLDIFDLLGPVTARADKAVRQKRYTFDSRTGLLVRVNYVIRRQGRDVKVETALSEWRQVDGQGIAGQVTRTEDGRVIFRFRNTAFAAGARAQDGIFSRP